MTEVNYDVEFPGETAEGALLDAKDAERVLPFEVEWSHIDLSRFWGGSLLAVANKKDFDTLQEFREREWEWVARLKAKGRLV